MRNSVRLAWGGVMGVSVYVLAVRIVPSLRFVQQMVREQTWLSGGDVTQIVLLIVSLALILGLGRGDLAAYGLRGAKASQVAIPVLVSVLFSLAVLGPGMAWVMQGGSMESEGAGMGMGLLKSILSVWVLGSVCEEIFYRGLLLGFLDPLKQYGLDLFRWRISVPVIVCAFGFGLGHLILLGRLNTPMVVFIVINATILGLLAGYYRESTGSIVPAIAVHMTFNAVGAGVPMILMRALSP